MHLNATSHAALDPLWAHLHSRFHAVGALGRSICGANVDFFSASCLLTAFHVVDAGLDIDALRDVANAVNGLKTDKTATLMVTHYKRLLNYIKPEHVHVMEVRLFGC